MLISDEYRALNAALHAESRGYGTSGFKWAAEVRTMAQKCDAESVLDYGCGRSTLKSALGTGLPFRFNEYDPAIPGKDEMPEPVDLVVCGDVLEHIEPDCLDAVLDDLCRLTKKAVFLVIATRPARKFLGDGRNAHLIVEPGNWWLRKIVERWNIKLWQDRGGECLCIGSAL